MNLKNYGVYSEHRVQMNGSDANSTTLVIELIERTRKR